MTARNYDPVEAYRKLYLIRHVEEEIVRLYYPDPTDLTESPMRCPVHLSIGQEGVAVGVAMAVPPGSHAYSTHRCHAHYLAWGGSLEKMLGELYGKATGCSGGRAGSMHLADPGVGFIGTSAVVGSSVSLAVGDAFSAKLGSQSERVTVAFGGDAVLETGQFWEALNFATLYELRVLFVIEDNGLSTATPKSKRQAGIFDAWTMYQPKNDSAVEVHRAAGVMLRGPLPAILTVKTRRFHEHVGMARMPEFTPYPVDDPVAVARKDAVKDITGRNVEYTPAIVEAVLAAEEDMIEGIVTAHFEQAEAAPWPEVTSAV